jgi:hypothetical protein
MTTVRLGAFGESGSDRDAVHHALGSVFPRAALAIDKLLAFSGMALGIAEVGRRPDPSDRQSNGWNADLLQ